MAYEHAPWRAKGRYTGIVQAGFPVGLLLANPVFLYSVHLGDTWAWRVPFLASILLVAVGLVIRSKVPESPVFEEVKETGTVAASPIKDALRYDWRNILRGIGLRVAETAGYAVSITYMISYLNTSKLTETSQTRGRRGSRAAHRVRPRLPSSPLRAHRQRDAAAHLAVARGLDPDVDHVRGSGPGTGEHGRRPARGQCRRHPLA
jgi:hypothetical protein